MSTSLEEVFSFMDEYGIILIGGYDKEENAALHCKNYGVKILTPTWCQNILTPLGFR